MKAWRQGDVGIRQIDKLPADAKPMFEDCSKAEEFVAERVKAVRLR